MDKAVVFHFLASVQEQDNFKTYNLIEMKNRLQLSIPICLQTIFFLDVASLRLAALSP